MRDLSCFRDSFFDIVRYHASLIHLPVLGKGYLADLALAEGHRVLKTRGLVYISAKKGNGVRFVDSGEGLGSMLCQFHTEETLEELLARNDFRIIERWEKPSSRNVGFSWICVLAEKK